MAQTLRDNSSVMRDAPEARIILASNLKKLMDRPGAKKISTYDVAGYRKGEEQGDRPLSPKTVERMRRGEGDVTLDHIQAVAKFFVLQPWQLLVPTFSVDDPPHLAFTKAEKEAYERMEQSISLFRKNRA